jgi:integrase
LREKCSCRLPVAEWADAKATARAELWHQGRLSELEAITKPREKQAEARMKLAVVTEAYGRCSLQSAGDNVDALELVYTAVTGKAVSDGFVDEITVQMFRRFAALYQEYGRRGWAKRGEGPTDAWAQLRALKPAPELDWETPATWNTTIRSTLARVKSIFGAEAREKYLHSIADALPASLHGLKDFSLNLPKPDNRDAMTQAQYLALVTALPGLREMDLRMWLLVRMAMETGLRSIELLAIRRDWLEVDSAGTVLLVVKQRSNFRLKDRQSKMVREIPLPTDVLEGIRELSQSQAMSIYGLATPGQIDALYRRVNSWVRSGGYVAADSDQVLYVVGRKTRSTALARTHGMTAAAAAAGHANSATTATYYVSPTVRAHALSSEETAAALQAERTPFLLESTPGK